MALSWRHALRDSTHDHTTWRGRWSRRADAGAAARAQMPAPGKRGWAREIPVIRIGLLGGENDADRLARYGGYRKLMEDTFQVPVKLLIGGGLCRRHPGVRGEASGGRVYEPGRLRCRLAGEQRRRRAAGDDAGSGRQHLVYSVMYVRADSGITALAR